MADYQPKFLPGREVTYTASADVKGGRVVVITGDEMVAHSAGPSTKSPGVAMYDAAAGEKVVVMSHAIHRLIASGDINPGDSVASAADGKVAVAAPGAARLGLATAGADDGDIALIKFDF
jgi:predicted RecA/RadA family phage recombinase